MKVLKKVNTNYWLATAVICGIFALLGWLAIHSADVILPDFKNYVAQYHLDWYAIALCVLGVLLYRLGRLDVQPESSSNVGQMLHPQLSSKAISGGGYRRVAIHLDKRLKAARHDLELAENRSRRLRRFRAMFGSAVLFAVAYMVGAATQGLVQDALGGDMTKLQNPMRFVGNFWQSIVLAMAACCIGVWQVRGFRKRQDWEPATTRDCFQIGFIGVSLTAIFWILQVSPEQLLKFQDVRYPPIDEYFGTSYLIYLLASKFVVFPVLGLIGAFVGKGR